MTADYKSHGHRPEKKPLPGFIWLLVGLSIGLFVALVVYLDKQPENKISFEQAIERDLAKLRKDDTGTASEAAPAPKVEKEKEPIFQYTYHTILKELEVLIPTEELRLGGDEKSPGTAAPAPLADDRQYLLQAGSFRNQPDAERLKAELALLGLQAKIESVTIRSERWYRVRLGPFSDSGSAFRELNRLKANGITAMAFTLKNGE